MSEIDLRSDTVTRPTSGMRDAIARAEVGDDVYGEDPTINRLEEVAAARVGKAAAVFVPSGTMANQIALGSLAAPGDVVVAACDSHVLRYESGAPAALWGVQIATIGSDGIFDVDELLAAIPHPDVHHAPATVLSLENTHNVSGGRVWPIELLEAVAAGARERGLRVHLDGARLFNAACASGEAPSRIAAVADTVSFCLSKGLGAPVGSLVCGDAQATGRMRRLRKMLGGGMRQAGFLAAAGLYALEHHVERLQEDHVNASQLADGLQKLGFGIDRRPETNLVVASVPPDVPGIAHAPALARALRERGVRVAALDRERLRCVTHLDVDATDIEEVLARVAAVLSEARA